LQGGVDAVKLEGGSQMRTIIEALVNAGIVVIGHIGLCPQVASSVGGFRVRQSLKCLKELTSSVVTRENI
jgi:3-methyl-2-oxobutanoate hydroxymethyltransferase